MKLERFTVEMSCGFVGEDKAGKERNRRCIPRYIEVSATQPAAAAVRRHTTFQS